MLIASFVFITQHFPVAKQKFSNEFLYDLLEEKYRAFNTKHFLKDDPILIPHRFSKQQDIEITAFWTAILAWGNRTSIINSASKLFQLMDNAPHQFITQHQPSDLQRLLEFKHRTFNATDALYFVEFLKQHFSKYHSLEDAFLPSGRFKKVVDNGTVENGLASFHHYFFSIEDAPQRTRKHIATPERKSTCKRLNMFLRWLVRKDKSGVDLSKAAETYKRIYNGIESQTGRRLTNDEKISLRPQISDIIKQIQNR